MQSTSACTGKPICPFFHLPSKYPMIPRRTLAILDALGNKISYNIEEIPQIAEEGLLSATVSNRYKNPEPGIIDRWTIPISVNRSGGAFQLTDEGVADAIGVDTLKVLVDQLQDEGVLKKYNATITDIQVRPGSTTEVLITINMLA
jgi:hypothetical protein